MTAKEEINKTMGAEYVQSRNYHTKSKGAQEAHEAIRPTYLSNHEIEGTSQERRLYELIWKRTIASQMSDAILEKTTVEISISGLPEKFVTIGEVIKFDGFLKVYIESTDDDENADGDSKLLPPLTKGEALTLNEATATERFTQRPPRYSEASLVRKMEELGIGRPSTYAPTISTIQNREYVEKGDKEGQQRAYNVITLKGNKISEATQNEIIGADRGKLIPTDIGTIVNDFLTEHFPNIMDYNFTANVEQEFDHVAEGLQVWTKAIDSFYKLFHPEVVNTLALRTETRVGERILGADPKTGRQVSVKISRFGPVVQIGKQDEDEKPLFASLLKGHSMSTITLEEALKLFELPRQVGEYEGKVVTIGVGRFGPYVRHDSKYVSLPKEFEPMTVTLEESIALIEAKRKQESERLIKTFEQNENLRILNGRFGPYIALDKNNYKIPKGTDPKNLTYEDCMDIVNAAGEAPKTVSGKKTSTKKAAAAKTKATATKTKAEASKSGSEKSKTKADSKAKSASKKTATTKKAVAK
jgi:Topoisomerase IA